MQFAQYNQPWISRIQPISSTIIEINMSSFPLNAPIIHNLKLLVTMKSDTICLVEQFSKRIVSTWKFPQDMQGEISCT